MALVFYPYEEDIDSSDIPGKLDILLENAEKYKAAVLDLASKGTATVDVSKRSMPRDIQIAFNWEEIAKVLHEIRDLPEATVPNRTFKADSLTKLAEIYEVLRSAKMPKLEAVRLAITSEANQIRSAVA